jgi:UDP-N-acetylmuramyl pentapeptide synthase
MLGIDELYKELKSSNFLVDIDSRKIRKGSVFFAIKGESRNQTKNERKKKIR